MIAEFKIRNFRSLKEAQTLSFVPTADATMKESYTIEVAKGVRLLKVACIYGSNASGKTNILEALDFFVHFMVNKGQKKGDSIGVVPFLFDDSSCKGETEFEMTFYLQGERYRLNVVLDDKVVYSETLQVYTSVQPTTIYSREYDADSDSTIVNFSTKSGLLKKSREVIQGNAINNRTVIAAFGLSNVEKTRLNLVYEMFSSQIEPTIFPTISPTVFTIDRLTGNHGGLLKKFILHFLKASDFNISDVSVNSDTHQMLFTHHTANGDGMLADELESRGTKRYMAMATILYDLLVHGKMISIDEVETSIHYELLAYFLKVFLVNSKGQAQLVVTTHDINLLDEDFVRRDTIWFTEKNDNGETQLLRLSSLGLHKTLSAYNAYRQEKLVNLPFLDSIYLDMDEYGTERKG